MAIEFKVTTAGITNHKLGVVRSLIVEMHKARYGEDAQTSSDSYDGLLIDIKSLLVQMLQEAIVGTYNNSFLRTSSGNAVDLILDLFSRKRLAAVASTASLVFYGANGTLVGSGTRATVAATERAFASTEDVTLYEQGNASANVTVVIISNMENEDGNSAEVAVQGFNVGHIVLVADTNLTVAQALADLVNAHPNASLQASATTGGLDENGAARLVLDHKIDGRTVVVGGTVSGGSMTVHSAGRVTAKCTVTGPITATAGELDTLTTPIFGVEGVTTTTDAIIGRNKETDTEYKTRHLRTLRSGGLGTPLAIRDRILENVLTVIECKVFENEEDIVDADGVPPHAFEAVFFSEYDLDNNLDNDEDQVLEQVLISKAAGIKSHGDIAKIFIDGQGFPKTIRASRGEVRYLHLRVTLTPGEGFPELEDAAAVAEFQANLAADLATFLQRDGKGELKLGTDFVRFQLAEAINESVSGVQDALIESDDTAVLPGVPVFVDQDIAVADRTILVADSGRITIIIV